MLSRMFFVGVPNFRQVGFQDPSSISMEGISISWINSELLNVDWGFLFDTLTISTCCVVTSILSLRHLRLGQFYFYLPWVLFGYFYLLQFTGGEVLKGLKKTIAQLYKLRVAVVGYSLMLLCGWIIYMTGDRSGDKMLWVFFMNQAGEVDLLHVITEVRWPSPAMVFYGDPEVLIPAYNSSPFVSEGRPYPQVTRENAIFINCIEFYYLVLEGGYDAWQHVFWRKP